MNNVNERVPVIPPLDTLTDGRGMDNRVEIGRYAVVGKVDEQDIIPEGNLTEEEKADILRRAPLCSDAFKGWVGTPDWIVWEAVDGTLHVYNGRNPDGSVKGEGTVVPRV
jgi:hypothetical protein